MQRRGNESGTSIILCCLSLAALAYILYPPCPVINLPHMLHLTFFAVGRRCGLATVGVELKHSQVLHSLLFHTFFSCFLLPRSIRSTSLSLWTALWLLVLAQCGEALREVLQLRWETHTVTADWWSDVRCGITVGTRQLRWGGARRICF